MFFRLRTWWCHSAGKFLFSPAVKCRIQTWNEWINVESALTTQNSPPWVWTRPSVGPCALLPTSDGILSAPPAGHLHINKRAKKQKKKKENQIFARPYNSLRPLKNHTSPTSMHLLLAARLSWRLREAARCSTSTITSSSSLSSSSEVDSTVTLTVTAL